MHSPERENVLTNLEVLMHGHCIPTKKYKIDRHGEEFFIGNGKGCSGGSDNESNTTGGDYDVCLCG